MKISVAIACYEMHGRGGHFLRLALQSVAQQDYPWVEVVVSDHSRDHVVEAVCSEFAGQLDLHYLRYAEKFGSASANTNNAMRHCSGELIKILCQDDVLLGADALSKTAAAFTPGVQWLLTDYLHMRDGRDDCFDRRAPWLNGRIERQNSVGTHSCLTVRSNGLLYFDEQLLWFLDCEYFRRLYQQFGEPVFLRETTVAVMIWEGQATHTSAASQQLRDAELARLLRLYPQPIAGLRLIEPAPQPSLLQRLAGRLRRAVAHR